MLPRLAAETVAVRSEGWNPAGALFSAPATPRATGSVRSNVNATAKPLPERGNGVASPRCGTS